ncbi:MAG: hypothetical protein WB762_01435 [Candidatus Sulfotelmatobacter sp.]
MDAILGVYELNKVDLLRDVFIWAYERSAARYAAVRQSLGEPDPFRFKHKAALQQIVGEVVRGRMDRKTAAGYITAWVEKNGIPEAERENFRDVVACEVSLVKAHQFRLGGKTILDSCISDIVYTAENEGRTNHLVGESCSQQKKSALVLAGHPITRLLSEPQT